MVECSWTRLDAAILVLVLEGQVERSVLSRNYEKRLTANNGRAHTNRRGGLSKIACPHGPITMDGCPACEHEVPRNHVKLHLFTLAVQRNSQVSWLSTHRGMKYSFMCRV
jgi:hypothetical protein